ncbi:hypothetical protein [Desulfoluna spongiiphila]|uniref:hypothetical protein n=1 Tax=Desulfoluna spongiiphila TaxID=419481 RepID=UPI0012558D01|nr:hypothetical protein [Desulfoluna spongiiphila]VVS92159.1 hypothetical protein DBB_17270 [Desulfoluna spongiiphila]
MKTSLLSMVFAFMALLMSSYAFASENPFENYRYDPFQFPYKEYYYTADVVPLTPTSKASGVPLDLFGLSAALPAKYMGELDRKSNTQIQVRSEHGLVILRYEEDDMMGCRNEKARAGNLDFCSAFKSTREFYQKLFTLTPDNAGTPVKRGDLWILHEKGVFFEHAEKIRIYEGQEITGYSKAFTNPEWKIRQEVVIFHDQIPKKGYIVMATTIDDDSMVTALLSSLKPMSGEK